MRAELLSTAVEDRLRRRDRADPFAWVRDATDAHRNKHGCWAYPYEDGTVLGAVVAEVEPVRVLELGTALGYTSCWWSSAGAQVDTVERDPVHVRLARANIDRAGLTGTVNVHEGDFDVVVPTLDAVFDLVFFDGYEPPTNLLDRLTSSIAAGGVLVTTNLDLGRGRARSLLSSTPGWATHFVEDVALSVRTSAEESA